MATHNFIMVCGSESPSELDDKYNKWLTQEYIPNLFKDSNVLAATHYEIVKGLSDPTHPGLAEPKGGYAKYLTIYEFENEEKYRAFENGSAMKEALAKASKTWQNGEITIKFQAQYRCRGSWMGQRQAKAGLIHITGVVVPEEADAAFNGYFHENTIPTMIKNPNLLKADSYQLIKGLNSSVAPFGFKHEGEYPKYYNIYELEGPEVFSVYEHSTEMLTNNKNFAKFASAWPLGTFRLVMRAQYVLSKTWAK